MASVTQLAIQSRLDTILSDLGTSVGGDIVLTPTIAKDSALVSAYLKKVTSIPDADKMLFQYFSSLTME